MAVGVDAGVEPGGRLYHLFADAARWLGANILRADTRPARRWPRASAGAWRSFSGWVGAAFTLAPRPAVALAAVAAAPAAPACGCTGSDCRSDRPCCNRKPVRRQLWCGRKSCRCPQRKPRGLWYACSSGKPAGAQPSFGRRLAGGNVGRHADGDEVHAAGLYPRGADTHCMCRRNGSSPPGGDQPFVIALAALLGVPIYTSNLAAMPLIAGLLAQGMSPAPPSGLPDFRPHDHAAGHGRRLRAGDTAGVLALRGLRPLRRPHRRLGVCSSRNSQWQGTRLGVPHSVR